MKKKWVMMIALAVGLFAFSACAPNEPDDNNKQDDTALDTKQYITHFDGYTQCIVFPAATWQYTVYNYGKVVNDWNTDERYVSEGTGSIKVSLMDGYHKYQGKIEADNGFVSSITDINGATEISLDICNPSQKNIEVTVEIESVSGVMVAETKLCLPGQWTRVSAQIEDKLYDPVSWYSITLENVDDAEPFTVFMDNFYIDFAS